MFGSRCPCAHLNPERTQCWAAGRVGLRLFQSGGLSQWRERTSKRAPIAEAILSSIEKQPRNLLLDGSRDLFAHAPHDCPFSVQASELRSRNPLAEAEIEALRTR